MSNARFYQIIVATCHAFKMMHPYKDKWPVATQEFFTENGDTLVRQSVDQQQSNLVVADLFKHLLLGGGAFYDLFKTKLNEDQNKDVIYDAAIDTQDISAQDAELNAFVKNIRDAFCESPSYTNEVNEFLDRITQFQGALAKNILFSELKDLPKHVDALVKQYDALGDVALSIDISRTLLKQPLASVHFMIQLMRRAPAIDRSDLWITLIKMQVIAPETKINGQTIAAYWHARQPKGYMIFENKPGSEAALIHSADLLHAWLAKVHKNFGGEGESSNQPAEKIALLSQPFDPLTLKTPLQQAAMLYSKLPLTYLAPLENLINHLLRLETIANNTYNTRDGVSIAATSCISIAHERGESWIETLLMMEPDPFRNICENIPIEMLKEFKDKKLDEKLIGKLRDPFVLTYKARAIECNQRLLIKRIDIQNTAAIEQSEKAEVLRQRKDQGDPSAQNVFIIATSVCNVVIATISDHFQVQAYNDKVLPQIRKMSILFPLHERERELILKSIQHSLSLLVIKKSFFHSNQYEMVDRFIYLLKNLEFIFEKFSLNPQSPLEQDMLSAQPYMPTLFIRMLLSATPGQRYAIKESALYKSLLKTNNDELNYFINTDTPLAQLNIQNAFFLKAVKGAANDCVRIPADAKGFDKADYSCAQYIKTTLEEKSFPTYTDEQKNMAIAHYPALCQAKILLRIIDYRISSYKKEEKIYDKLFYKDLTEANFLSQGAPLTLLNQEMMQPLMQHYCKFFIQQIEISLEKIVPIDFADCDRVKSLKDSLDFLTTKLGLKMAEIELPLTKAVYQRLCVFYPKDEEAESSSASSRSTLTSYSEGVPLYASIRDSFMEKVIQKAKRYADSLYNSYKPGHPEKSLHYAKAISQLAYNPKTKTENLKQLLFVNAILNIVSFRIASYEDDKYEKSLYSDSDGFKVQLNTLPPSVELSKNHQEMILEKIKEALNTPGLSVRQDEVRTLSLVADLNLFIEKFALRIEPIENCLANTGFVAVHLDNHRKVLEL